MSVGFPTDKANIDGKAGNIALQIRDGLIEASRMKAWLDSKTAQDLIALGYVQADVDALKSAFTDLDNLAKIASGTQGGQTAPNNYQFWSGKLTGVN